MSVEIAGVDAQNITVVYQTLNPAVADTRRLKALVAGGAAPAVMDMPDRIVAVWPSILLIIELGDNRIRVTSQRPSPSIGDVPLWDYVVTCDDLVQPAQRIARGFNYDVGVTLQGDDAARLLIKRFVADRLGLEKTLGGILMRFNPRLVFQREDVQYDIIVEPVHTDRVKVHCNVQFEDASLPTSSQLRDSYNQQYAYFASLVPKLLAQEAI